MEWSDLGAPYMFTEWGTDDYPVAADGGPPEARGFGHPCMMTHAVFVPAHTLAALTELEDQ